MQYKKKQREQKKEKRLIKKPNGELIIQKANIP